MVKFPPSRRSFELLSWFLSSTVLLFFTFASKVITVSTTYALRANFSLFWRTHAVCVVSRVRHLHSFAALWSFCMNLLASLLDNCSFPKKKNNKCSRGIGIDWAIIVLVLHLESALPRGGQSWHPKITSLTDLKSIRLFCTLFWASGCLLSLREALGFNLMCLLY